MRTPDRADDGPRAPEPPPTPPAPRDGGAEAARDARDAREARDAPLPDLIEMDGVPRGPIKRAALLTAAGVFLLLGIVLWLTPVVTGLPFLVLAAITAGMASRRAATWVNRAERHLPHRLRLLLRRHRRHRRHRKPQDPGPGPG
jgi:hypothetical protein